MYMAIFHLTVFYNVIFLVESFFTYEVKLNEFNLKASGDS